MTASMAMSRYRSVFISDTHLGTRGCQAEFLTDFLQKSSADHIHLVGGIIDGWRLRRFWYWDAHHDAVITAILRQARTGAKVTYVPGNHDVAVRRFLPLGLEIAGVGLADEAEQVTSSGKRLLVIHGDDFDSVVRYSRALALLGDWAYTAALALNRYFNIARMRLGYPYWSLSAYLKRRVKEAMKVIDRFESALAADFTQRGFDGVVCGHIHHPEMREVDGVLYINDGDWVEFSTALVEHQDGRLISFRRWAIGWR